MKSARPGSVFSYLAFGVVLVAVAGAQTPAPTAADARALAIGRAYLRYQEELRSIYVAVPETTPWWRAPIGSYSAPALREKIAQAQRNFHEAIRTSLESEPIAGAGRDARYSFLPEAKQALVAQIDQAYSERIMELRRDAPNVRLPADAEKMKQFAATRDRDLSAVLTPGEREGVELRTSQSASTVRQRFGEVIESEDEFRKVFLLQKAFDEKFPIEDAIYSSRQQDLMRLRNDGERKLMDDIRDAVGEERFVLYRRAMDQDFQSIRAIVRRLGLPEATTDAAMKVRDHYAMQSLTINAETSLSQSDRRTLLQDLAKEARRELTETLTAAGVEAYSARAQWLRYLEQGTAFSTNPKDSASSFSSVTQSTYMVLPGGVTMTSSLGSPPPTITAVGSASGGTPTPPPPRPKGSVTPPAKKARPANDSPPAEPTAPAKK